MKKILYFIKTPPPVHGATLMNQFVHQSALLRKNFNIRAITAHYSIDVKEIGAISFQKYLSFFKVFIKLLYELIFHRPVLIYFQISPVGFAFLRDFIFVVIIKIFRVKIIFHLHGKGIKQAAQKTIKRKMYNFVFRNSKVICLGKMLVDDIKEVYKGKPLILNNGIPSIQEKSNNRNKDSIAHIVFLSNLILSKGIKIFLEAVRFLSLNGTNYRAEIVGKEADYTLYELQSFISDNKLEQKITFLGPKYNSDKAELLLNTDIFVFPTFYINEAFPLVILEAMQAGLPVISTFEGAIPEIVDDGITGFLVEKQNPKTLAEKIEILIKNKELREKMGTAGRKKFLEKYTLDIFERNMKNIFDEVLSCEH